MLFCQPWAISYDGYCIDPHRCLVGAHASAAGASRTSNMQDFLVIFCGELIGHPCPKFFLLRSARKKSIISSDLVSVSGNTYGVLCQDAVRVRLTHKLIKEKKASSSDFASIIKYSNFSSVRIPEKKKKKRGMQWPLSHARYLWRRSKDRLGCTVHSQFWLGSWKHQILFLILAPAYMRTAVCSLCSCFISPSPISPIHAASCVCWATVHFVLLMFVCFYAPDDQRTQ